MGFFRRFLQIVLGGIVILTLISSINSSTVIKEKKLVDKTKKNNVIIIGIEGTYPPFSFQNNDGKLDGFEVEFAQQLSARLGIKAILKPMKWDSMLAALNTKRIDMIINQVAISTDRKKKYDFSIPYTISTLRIVTTKDQKNIINTMKTLSGKKVGVSLGSNYQEWLISNFKDIDIHTYDDDATKYQDLISGRLSAILIDSMAAMNLIRKTNNTLVIVGKPLLHLESGIVLRKGNETLLKTINNIILNMKQDNSLKNLSEKWFGMDVTK